MENTYTVGEFELGKYVRFDIMEYIGGNGLGKLVS